MEGDAVVSRGVVVYQAEVVVGSCCGLDGVLEGGEAGGDWAGDVLVFCGADGSLRCAFDRG